jgi:His/Glu/Gln/Arg/opine family amino acid ABC transporter permease subunit
MEPDSLLSGVYRTFQIVWESLPQLFDGALLTIEITIISVLLGLCFAVPLALARVSSNPLLRWPVYGYIFYFRGTPLLVQIFLIYYGSGQFGDFLEEIGLWTYFREAYFCAVLTLTLNTAAYTAEILRGGIQAVPHGEIEAARAVGMSGGLLYRRIILPKAFRLALPAYANEVVFLFQATSLVSIITLMDLTGVARVIVARSFHVYEIYITAGLIYLTITYGILWVFRTLEFHLGGHLRERPATAVESKAVAAPTTAPR